MGTRGDKPDTSGGGAAPNAKGQVGRAAPAAPASATPPSAAAGKPAVAKPSPAPAKPGPGTATAVDAPPRAAAVMKPATVPAPAGSGTLANSLASAAPASAPPAGQPAAAPPTGAGAGFFTGTPGRAGFAPSGPPAGSGAGRFTGTAAAASSPTNGPPVSSAPSWNRDYPIPTGRAGTPAPAPSSAAPSAAAVDRARRAADSVRDDGVTGIPAAVAGGALTAAATPPAPGAGEPAAAAQTPAARADAERAALAAGHGPPPPATASPVPAPAAPATAAARAAPAERFVPPPSPPQAEPPAAPRPLAAPRHDPQPADMAPASAQGTSAADPLGGSSPDGSSQPPLLFEIAWEVCWQLGGIYTVLRSKAQAMIDRWGDRYCLVGPYNPNTAPVEFEEQPTYGPIREAMSRLREQGIPSYFGRWLIAGPPRVLLIDFRARYGSLGTDKYLMWEDHRIELPADDGEVNDVVAFGFAATEFFRHLGHIVKDRPVIAHFHEWMGGVAVPRMAHLRIPIATVFTTHATLLGRYLAGDNPNFYDHLPYLDPDKEAAKYQIYPKFALERAAAHASTVFTTVSDVTGVEAEKLLGRAPDMITPNGINLHRFAAPHEFQHLHAKYKEKINDFVKGHYFPSYSFDFDRTLYVFTSGRYEYRNKGMDMFIEAMHRLNWRLKGTPNPPTVVAFIITRAATKNINVRVLQNQSMYEDLRHTCQDVQQQMGNRLLSCVVRGQLPGSNDLLHEDEQVRLKRAMHAWKSNRQPLIVTHDLVDDAGDPILRHLRHRQMFNAGDDPVKMVFHPDFLSAVNPVMALDYEQFVRGTHMGIFPSYYEPWGYTPLECVALGVPTVTTDLAGFGSYAQKHVYARERRDSDRQGIQIVHRRGRSFDDACEALVNHLFTFCQYSRRQRIEMRNRTERLGEQFDWSTLSRHYDDAHSLALERVGASRRGHLEVRVV